MLHTIWFLLIAVLWIGYFFLEGFDFGSGILLPFLGKTHAEKRAIYNAVGPVWDGNEVWVLTAGGAIFAAFPQWYASLFSGFYLALFVILLALIVRICAFEYRSKIDSDTWRKTWDGLLVFGSVVPALLWGVAFGNIVMGVPLETVNGVQHVFTGTFFTLLRPFPLLAGLTTLLVFTLHGAIFLSLKTAGDLAERARKLAWPLGIATVVVGAAFILVAQFWLLGGIDKYFIGFALTAVLLIVAVVLSKLKRPGWSFISMGLTIAVFTGTLFWALYPNVLPSTISPATNSLTIDNAASSDYTLTLMTWVACIMVPIVLIYMSWTYWVFRKRVDPSTLTGPTGLPPSFLSNKANPPAAPSAPSTPTPEGAR
ncbi:MAG TPA: cytochrome d ubiquinol oxidase subunit II [Pseudonocardiaceae bacterium]